jgi:hypothetical protein
MAGMVNLSYVPNMTCQAILLCLPLQMCTAQRFMFSGMRCCVVVQEVADISKDRGVFIFRAKGFLLDCLSLKMKALWSIAMKGTTHTTHSITSHKVWFFRNTILPWIGIFANKTIYFCRHYRSDIEAFISCYFCALPFTGIFTVALVLSSVWIMTQNERWMVSWILRKKIFMTNPDILNIKKSIFHFIHNIVTTQVRSFDHHLVLKQ